MKLATLFSIRYVPRWCIVCMDVLLTFFAVVLSYLLRFNFDTQKINKNFFTRGILITVLAYLFFFFIFKSFKEVIRHTTFRGILRIFLTVSSASLFLIVTDIALNNKIRLVPYSLIGINFFISFFILAGSRMAIKKTFETALASKKNPVIIFGAGAMGQAA